ncbi:MAG: zf-HC2 domain-containing protein [Deltaproteobacteria bacterium]|nr:zf-HC2 domain-containing protein [Deltaproteobacteria bacterium]
MDCRKAQEMISAYHDGELSAAGRARVEAQLRGCPDCAALLESIARIDAAAEVPDPGPEYWDRFNSRVEERIAGEGGRPLAGVSPRPKRGWVRHQHRYQVPAAAAAVLLVVVFRTIGRGPGVPAPSVAPPAMEAPRVPPSPAVPAPAARSRKENAAPAAVPRAAEEKAVADGARPQGALREAPAPPQEASRKIPAPGAMTSGESGGKAAVPAAPETAASMKRESEAAKAREGAGVRLPPSGCGEARSLAARERFKDAEAAQRACLSRNDAPEAQESGLVFLAELLDRQHRFAEADAVIEETHARFPGSRPLELYRQQRRQVQSGQAPYPAGR